MNFKALKHVEVSLPEWSDEPVLVREPRVRDFLGAKDLADPQDRTLFMLSACVFMADGTQVTRDEILDAPLSVLQGLTKAMQDFMTQEIGDPGPLAGTSGSDSDLPSP